MPEGLLDGLNTGEVRDLIGYLRNRSQVPLPPPASESTSKRCEVDDVDS